MLKGLLFRPAKRTVGIYYFSSRSTQIEVKDKNPYKTQVKPIDLSFETKKLYETFSDVHDDILNQQLVYYKQYPDLRQTYSKLLHYTMHLEPRYIGRGIFSIYAYKLLEKPELFTEENLKKACVIAWCHKLMDATIIVEDDIVDVTELRYNKPAWYKVEDVGEHKAILDAAFLSSSMWFLLLKHLSTHKYFPNIMKQILTIFSVCNVSERIDITQHRIEDLEKHTYSAKGVALAMPVLRKALYLANIDVDAHKATEEFSIDLAYFLKFEDDFNGVFNPMSDEQKTCTDIAEGRPSWVPVQAYKMGNLAQKKILEEHFGKNNEESIRKCYELFKELRLEQVFADYKENFYNKMYAKIHQNLPKILPVKLFLDYLNFCLTTGLRV
ncbi:unnamed protein product [Diabrotica balteata]|uniref:Farnesyl pyrophosphate synthase n=1 Tax=Diabrotica balteata TaxID=107213 RepID=A0A9N9SSQ4_DIABA|nr:unnamed protein product [Diabrotica balteata]